MGTRIIIYSSDLPGQAVTFFDISHKLKEVEKCYIILKEMF